MGILGAGDDGVIKPGINKMSLLHCSGLSTYDINPNGDDYIYDHIIYGNGTIKLAACATDKAYTIKVYNQSLSYIYFDVSRAISTYGNNKAYASATKLSVGGYYVGSGKSKFRFTVTPYTEYVFVIYTLAVNGLQYLHCTEGNVSAISSL